MCRIHLYHLNGMVEMGLIRGGMYGGWLEGAAGGDGDCGISHDNEGNLL